MDHKSWPDTSALGVVLIDRGSNHWTGEHGMAGTWQVSDFAPTRELQQCASSTSTEPQRAVSSGHRRDHAGGGEPGLAHPASTVWDLMGKYRWDAWRLQALVGARDVLVTVDDLGWMKRSAAYAFLAKARAAYLLVDGLWQGTRVQRDAEGLGEEGMWPTKYARAQAAEDSARRTEGLSRHAQLDAYLERTQGEYRALALERESQCAIEWAKEMGDPDLRRAFAYAMAGSVYSWKPQPEVVEGWTLFAAKVPSAQEPAPVTMNERLAARMVASW